MCGKEHISLDNADPGIYYNAPFAFIRLARTSQKAVSLAENLCLLLKSHPVWVDANTHDRWTAFSSHVPFLVSSAAVDYLPVEAAALVGSGFESLSRLASTPSSMMVDVLFSNREYILEALEQFQNSLVVYKDLLSKEKYSEFCALLDLTREKKANLAIQKKSTRS